MLEQEKISRIKVLLKSHPKGLTITDISSKLKLNRNSAAKYLEILQISGQVESKSYGTAKVYFLTHRLPISALVSLASDLVITLDENYKILFVNDGFCTLFRIKNEDATGSHIIDIFKSGFGKDILPGVFSDLIADQETAREVCLPREEGGELFFKIRSMKTVFDDGSRGITLTMEDITREKTDKIELEAKESRYRGIVEDQTEFIVRFLPDDTITFVNPSFCHLMKKTAEELAGSRFSDAILPKDKSVFERCLGSLDRKSPVVPFECRISLQKGMPRWVAWTLRGIFGDGKKPVEFQAVGHDITESKEADQKIQQYITQMEFFSNELQHFIELSPGENIYEAICTGLAKILPDAAVSVSSFDPVSISLTVRAFAGKKDHEFVSRSLGRDIVGMRVPVGDTAPHDRFFNDRVYNTKKRLYEIFFRQIPEETCFGIEDTLNLGEIYAIGLIWKKELLGNISFALRKGRYLKNEACVEAYARAASIVLKRALAEQALKESESLYRTVLENIQDIFYRADTEGNLIMASPSGAVLLGYSPTEDIRGKNIGRDLYYEPEKRQDFLAAIASKGSVTGFEVALKKKDGSPVYIETNSHILYDKNGSVLGIEGIIRDITERKKSEERIQQYLRDMEFLSRKLQEFILLEPSENIYDKIAKDLEDLIPGAMIFVNSFDRHTDILKVKSAAMTGQQREKALHLLGKEIIGSEFPVNADATAVWKNGKLQKADYPLYEILFRSIPEPVCTRLEADLDIGFIYAIGFVRGEEIMGDATIILVRGGEIPEPRLVELYARVAAIAIQRFTADEARKKTDEIFFHTAKNSPFPIALIEPDGTYTFVNDSFIRLFGYDLADFRTGREWFRLIFPDQADRHRAVALWKADQAQSPNGQVISRTFSVRCGDGSMKEVVFRPITMTDGNLCVICEDITERIRAERTQQLLASIVGSTSDAVIAKSLEGTVISWNQAAEQLYGYTKSEMIGQPISRIIPAERREEMDRISGIIAQGDSVDNMDTQRVRKDGKVIDVSVTISPIKDMNGGVIGASTIARDITAHKAEARLRENEQQYRSLVDNISVGIYRSTGDPTGRFVWGNSSLVRILGYPTFEELKDVGISDIFVEHDGRKKLLEDLRKDGFVKNRELALHRPDGGIVTVLVTALARFDQHGELSCINGIVEDITRQRTAEMRMQIADRQMHDILGAVRDPVVIVDSENRVAAWNAAMEQLTGAIKADSMGYREFGSLLPFNDSSRPPLFSFFDSPDEELRRYYPGARRDGSAIVAQVKDRSQQDELSGFFTIRVTPLCDPQGGRVGAVQIVHPPPSEGGNRAPFRTEPVSPGMEGIPMPPPE